MQRWELKWQARDQHRCWWSWDSRLLWGERPASPQPLQTVSSQISSGWETTALSEATSLEGEKCWQISKLLSDKVSASYCALKPGLGVLVTNSTLPGEHSPRERLEAQIIISPLSYVPWKYSRPLFHGIIQKQEQNKNLRRERNGAKIGGNNGNGGAGSLLQAWAWIRNNTLLLILRFLLLVAFLIRRKNKASHFGCLYQPCKTH